MSFRLPGIEQVCKFGEELHGGCQQLGFLAF